MIFRGIILLMTEFIFEYPEKLEPVFDFTGRYIVLTGGRSSSKSHFVARKILTDTLAEKRDIICLREFQANLKQSNYKLFYNLISQYKLPFKVYADHFVSRTTGSEIIFKGMNDLTADGIKSYEGFKDAWVEEAQSFSANSFQKLDPTIRQEDSRIYVTLNPEAEEGDPVVKEIKEKYSDKALFIHINYLDNPFCPQSIIEMAEACKKHKPDEYQQIWLGKPLDKFKNTVVQHWTKANEHPIAYQPTLDLHISCDFNWSPNCWILGHKTDDKAFFFKEYCLDMRTEDLIKVVLEDYPHNGRIVINGDASGTRWTSNSKHSDYDHIRNGLIAAGYRPEDEDCKSGKRFVFDLPLANGSRKARFDAWNAKVKNSNTGEVEIYMNPKGCPKLLMNMKELKVVIGTSEFEMPTKTELRNNPDLRFLGHPFDAASYLVNRYWPINPLFKDYTVEPKVYSAKDRFDV